MAEKIHENWERAAPDRFLRTVRPAVVFGQGEGCKGVFVFPGRRHTIKSCIYVEDSIDLMKAAADLGQPHVVLNGSYPECPTQEKIVTTLRDAYSPEGEVAGHSQRCGNYRRQGHELGQRAGARRPSRAREVRSTHVFPEWGLKQGLFRDGAFVSGVDHRAVATERTFIYRAELIEMCWP
ncbi:hypothetical protein [Bradyrhizobium sp. 141]|uniref:hypothetical protein n=1 Tax=Bradyrhizobium sp. 141 TaxID=2782617 RepID=UPI001FF81AD6|nr:hypothetical protein [Bradyrhizobium sp. 141]MCK1722064.1 hypothetical protein [Bradyrhizobium sp. 141]